MKFEMETNQIVDLCGSVENEVNDEATKACKRMETVASVSVLNVFDVCC